jgi:DNA-binding MarR family transcriptional regulator
MNNLPPLRFNGCLVTNIEQTLRHLEIVYRRLVRRLGLSVLEWYALRALYQADGLSASELAERVCRHPSSLTSLLDRLEQKGLVRRAADPADRRSVRVFLTEQGRAREPAVQAVAGELETLVAEVVEPGDLAVFWRVLAVLQALPPPDVG